jgi:hypothetical protein
MTEGRPAQPRGVRRRLRPGEPPVRCAVTSHLLTPGDEAIQCLKCGRFHHLDGWMARGGCASTGCPNGPRHRSTPPPAPSQKQTATPPPVRAAPPPAPIPPAPPPVVAPLAGPPRIVVSSSPAPPPPPIVSAGRPARKIPDPTLVRVSAARRNARCPFTLDPLLPGCVAAKCSSCGQLMSVDGWKENAGCATYGCALAPDFRKDEAS